VLLEEGRYVEAREITHNEGRMSTLLYNEGGLQTTVDLGMTILQGRWPSRTTGSGARSTSRESKRSWWAGTAP